MRPFIGIPLVGLSAMRSGTNPPDSVAADRLSMDCSATFSRTIQCRAACTLSRTVDRGTPPLEHATPRVADGMRGGGTGFLACYGSKSRFDPNSHPLE